jgi:hypothetical protein
VLHRATLDAREVAEWTGFRVTTPLRTLVDAAAGDSVSTEQLLRAVEDALERGLVRRAKLIEAAAKHRAGERLARILKSMS